MIAAVLETLFTANTKDSEAGFTRVETRKKNLEKSPVKVKVDAEPKGALDAMDEIEKEGLALAKRRDFDPKIDADIAKARGSIDDITRELAVLEKMDPTLEVQADTVKAEKKLDAAVSRLKALEGLKAEMVVEADTGEAEQALDDVQGKAEESGGAGGKAFLGGFLGGLAATPIVGAVTGLIADIKDGIVSGLDNEVRADEFGAATGLDEVTVGRIGRVAAEAYANNFGDSIRANLDTAAAGIRSGLLDPSGTRRDAQSVVQSLDGVAKILDEDVSRASRSAAQLLRTGLAKDAQGAFDIIVKGQQAGLNVSEDWLDTIDEYSTQFRKLGLDGGATLGLLSQAVKAGARDTDTAADALKEFAIRAVDGSATTKHGFDVIGLSAAEMSAKIAQGGPIAAEALGQTLDGLRRIEDPALRSQAAVELFGTKAEDLGDALYAMDLSTAAASIGDFAGTAESAVKRLGDNTAGSIASAQRNIEVAADGIKGALAVAFGPQIEKVADDISGNREAVMTFLFDVANGALDMGRNFVEGIAVSTEAVGTFVAGPLADLVDGLAAVLNGIDNIPGIDVGDAEQSLRDAADSMRTFDSTTATAADTIRRDLIERGIDPAQQKLNEFGAPLLADAALHDATQQLAEDLDAVGYSAENGQRLLEGFNIAQDGTVSASSEVDAQLRAVVASLDLQAQKSVEAGDSQEELSAQYREGREALIQQMEAMGLTREQAETLIGTYGLIPERVDTLVQADTGSAQSKSDQLKGTLDAIGFSRPNPYVEVSGTEEGIRKLNQLKETLNSIPGFRQVGVGTVLAPQQAVGHIVQPMAVGGITGSYLDPIAQFVPPSTPRLVGDRLDVSEAYIPMDGSARSWSILKEVLRTMPGAAPMGSGGVVGATADSWPNIRITLQGVPMDKTNEITEALSWAMRRALRGGKYGGARG